MPQDYGKPPAEYLAARVADGKISKKDADLIQRFLNHSASKKGTSEMTLNTNVRYLVKIVNFIPGISVWNGRKIDEYMAHSRKTYKPNTVRKDVFILKGFCHWCAEQKIIKKTVCKEICAVKAPAADRMTKTASQMLTADEVGAIIAATKNTRDRAMLSVLFESAMRPSELLTMTWGQVKEDDKGAVINTAKKTGKPRYVRIIRSAGHLAAWKNDYPEKITDRAIVFPAMKQKPYGQMSRGALRKIIDKWVKASGVKKNVFAYLFRHSRVTDMLSKNVPESVIKTQCWGSLTTPMLATYGHLNNDQLDDLLMQAEGIAPKPKQESGALKPVTCPRCGTDENPAGLAYCGKCGAILDHEKYQEQISQAEDMTALKDEITSLKQAFSGLLKAYEDERGRRIFTELPPMTPVSGD